MATMNHTNLTTYNVPALTEFFCSVFGFQLIEKRADKLSVLRDADGFLLSLMYDKRMTPEQGYPGVFHVGFLQPTQHAVDLMHDELSARNYVAPKPAKRNGGSQHDEHCQTGLTAPKAERVRICILTRRLG